jgi:hypothetical protein
MPSPACTNREHLARLAALADANAAEVASVAADLDAARLLWRPSPERWGIADCLEHLITTGAAYHPRLRAALDGAEQAGQRGAAFEDAPWRPTWFGRWFVRAAGPGGRSIRARGPFVPPPGRVDSAARLLAQQDELRALIADARGADLRGLKVSSPLSRLLTLRVGEGLELLLVHQQRHLQQAWRVRRAPNFPRVHAPEAVR